MYDREGGAVVICILNTNTNKITATNKMGKIIIQCMYDRDGGAVVVCILVEFCAICDTL